MMTEQKVPGTEEALLEEPKERPRECQKKYEAQIALIDGKAESEMQARQEESQGVETIGREEALRFLSTNNNIRNLDHATAWGYARIQKAGHWTWNGDLIRFDVSGRMIDGQTRMMSIVYSGMPQKFLVMRGLQPSCTDSIDQGRKRRFAQVVAKQGGKNYSVVASICSEIHKKTHGLPMWSQGRSCLRPSISELALLYNERKDYIDELAAFSTQESFRLLNLHPKTVAASYLAIDLVSPKEARQFFLLLLTGKDAQGNDLSEDDPVAVLRKTFLGSYGRKQLSGKMASALLIKSWNLWAEGKPSYKRLSWIGIGPRTEEFPVPVPVPAPVPA